MQCLPQLGPDFVNAKVLIERKAVHDLLIANANSLHRGCHHAIARHDLRMFDDMGAGISQRDELSAVRQRDRLAEFRIQSNSCGGVAMKLPANSQTRRPRTRSAAGSAKSDNAKTDQRSTVKPPAIL